jgi:sugar phosphate isomerase/epimerase
MKTRLALKLHLISQLLAAAVWAADAPPVISGAQPVAPLPPSHTSLFSQANLLAWCIVPFDNRHRSPAERIAMLKRLGFAQYAWDWRQNHLKDLPEEIRLSRKAGVRLRAIWLWIDGDSDKVGRLGEGNRAVMEAVNQAQLSVEFWVGFHPNYFGQLDEAARVRRGAEMIAYLRDQAVVSHSTVALYNHGDWIGEPDNEIKIIQAVGDPSVGMVFNFHHAHTMIDSFPNILPRMLPYLKAVNINGMRPGGPKILPIGQGTHERKMLHLLQQCGYAGPIGILGHVEDADVEDVLRANLEGLRVLTASEGL